MILDNFNQWLVANTSFHETIPLLNQKRGSKEIWELDLYWKSRPVFSTSNMELKFESGLWVKTILILGSEYPMERPICDRLYWRQYRKSCRSTRRANSTNKHECGCSQVKGKSKTSTERTRWDDSNHTNTRKKMDWRWAIKTNSFCVRALEESDQSSSTQSNVTEGRRWSNWILQNQILSSKSSFTNTAFVWWSLKSCRRRFEKKLSVLLW